MKHTMDELDDVQHRSMISSKRELAPILRSSRKKMLDSGGNWLAQRLRLDIGPQIQRCDRVRQRPSTCFTARRNSSGDILSSSAAAVLLDITEVASGLRRDPAARARSPFD
jgi:hypothetical protein